MAADDIARAREMEMEQSKTVGANHSDVEERRHREAALDETIEASFPASDPPSTDPNPDAHEELENPVPADEEPASER
jgi:hypothetical protein